MRGFSVLQPGPVRASAPAPLPPHLLRRRRRQQLHQPRVLDHKGAVAHGRRREGRVGGPAAQPVWVGVVDPRKGFVSFTIPICASKRRGRRCDLLLK